MNNTKLKPVIVLDYDHRRLNTPGVLRWLAYPVLMCAVTAVAIKFYRPDSASILLTALFFVVFCMAIFLERVFPCFPEWRRPWRESWDDGIYFVLAQPAVILAEILALALGLEVALRLAEHITTPWNLSTWPFLVQCVIALIVSELPLYSFHRLCHSADGFLWRLHALHHAPDRVYTLNFSRFHPFNVFGNAVLTLLPLVALGVPPKVIFVVAVFQKTHGVLTHTNFDFRLGYLNWMFSMAELHRWHHNRDIQIANGNYGGTLIVWDVLFRTRRTPVEMFKITDVGLRDESKMPLTIWRQLVSIFSSSNHAQ